MRNVVLGFLLGVVVATAGFVGAQEFGQGPQGVMDLESGTMYQPVPGGLMNLPILLFRFCAGLQTEKDDDDRG